MHLVAILRWPSPVEAASASLARRTGLTPYDARTRLAGEPPRLAAIVADGAAAQATAAGLVADGFDARVLAASAIEHDATRDVVQSLALAPDGLACALRDGRTRTIPWAALALVVRGVRTTSSTVVEETKTKQFSAGRAILSGGLWMSKTKTSTSSRTEEAREGFLYLHEAGRGPGVAIYEHRTDYRFLGPELAPHASANFAIVLRKIRERAPGARVDERLVRPPALGAMPLAPGGFDPGEWRSDVAAAVIALGVA
jgi:hypothetical protein